MNVTVHPDGAIVPAKPITVPTELQGLMRQIIDGLQGDLEAIAVQHGQVETVTRHHFMPGVYTREFYMPAGAVVVGKRHKHGCVNFILAGMVSVFTEHNGIEHFAAPYVFVTQPGVKRVVVAHVDTVWATSHHNPNDIRDLAELEALLIEPEGGV